MEISLFQQAACRTRTQRSSKQPFKTRFFGGLSLPDAGSISRVKKE